MEKRKPRNRDNENNKQGWLVHVLGKYECDERDDKRDERVERETFGFIFRVLYPSRGSFKIFGKMD